MKKFLVRSGMSPLDTFSAGEIIKRNAIGNNVGNLMYAYSIFRNLTTDNVELVSDYYRTNPADAEMINETYDAYVIPLANAIRPSFIPTMKKYTELIEKLTIPVYVIGMGMAFPYEPNISAKRPFDNDVRRFVSAVLEKSSILGLRGQITADYLSYLGFQEGRDHQVIGCPSMYTFGNHIKIKDINLSDSSQISVNMTPKADQNILKFLDELSLHYENLKFIPQDLDEMLLTYSGTPLLGGAVNTNVESYPNSLKSHVYQHDKVRFFLSAPSWIDFMKTMDISVGTRLHGNVAPTLAGTPSITIPIDARMRELTEYHNFPRVPKEEIDETTTLLDLIEKVDLHSVEKSHQRNYDNFVSFLAKNDIEHVYDFNEDETKKPFEENLEKIQLQKPIGPITACSAEEMRERLEDGFDLSVEKLEGIKNKLNNTIKKKDKVIKDLKKSNGKAVSTLKKADDKIIAELKENIEKKQAAISQHKKQIKKLEVKLVNMENSRSWKLTKPLRTIRAKK